MGIDVIVGVPAYNEERSISSIIKASEPYASRVVVVDDGSFDRTSEFARDAGALVIRHERNAGKGVAVSSLFDFAKREDAEILVLLDGDGQHDPAEIPRFLSWLTANRADMVVGSRFLSGASDSTPYVRRLGQEAFNLMTYMASGVRCSDSQSGFRAFSRRAITLMEFSATSFSVESEMQFECRRHGLSIVEVPISCSYESPRKRNVFRHGTIVLSGLVTLTAQRRSLPRSGKVSENNRPGLPLLSVPTIESPAFEVLPMGGPGD